MVLPGIYGFAGWLCFWRVVWGRQAEVLEKLSTSLLVSESRPYKTQIWEMLAILCLGSAQGRVAVP